MSEAHTKEHIAFMDLVTQFIHETGSNPTTTSIGALMAWSYRRMDATEVGVNYTREGTHG